MKNTFVKKLVIVLGILSIITVAVIIFNMNNVYNDNIHLNMWSIFDDEKIMLTEKACDEYSIEKEKCAVGLEKFSDFEYNDTIYYSTAYSIDKSLLDNSKNIGKVHRHDDTSQTIQAYEIKNVNSEYMLAAEIEGIYVLYYNWKCRQDSLKEYINLIGPKENLEVAYVKVELLNNEAIEKQYIYYNDIEEWVWQLLTQKEHRILNRVSGIKDVSDYEYPERSGNLIICIRNKYTGAEYLTELLANGNLAITDVYSIYEHQYEYEFQEEELSEALTALVKNYKAYKVN